MYSAAYLSPELTRPFRGLQLWFSLQLLGVQFFRDTLREKLLLASYFYQKILTIPGIMATKPVLSIVVFRYIPKQTDADSFNLQLYQEIIRDGTVYLSTTRLNQQYCLRFACVSFRSHLVNVDNAIQVITDKINLINSIQAKEIILESA